MTTFSNKIAKKFLFSPKSHSVINILSRVSMVAVGIPVAALVVLMSVWGGFDGLIRDMYRGFDPGLWVVPAQGKVFEPTKLMFERLYSVDGISGVSTVLEESALLEYRGAQRVATVRGEYKATVPAGEKRITGAILGQGVAYDLGVRWLMDSVKFYAPGRGAYSALFPMSAFTSGELPIKDVFALDAETDGRLVFVPLAFAQKLFGYDDKKASALAIRFADKADEKKLRREVEKIVGPDFEVKNRYEQRPAMYRIMAMEKWGVFFIGLAVLIIASLSIAGSLVMLVIDKREGIKTLRALGANRETVRSIFVRQGMMIGGLGALGGVVLGVAVCAAQQIWGVVRMPGATFLIDSYPVAMRPADIAIICAAFIAVNYLITIFTVRIALRNE